MQKLDNPFITDAYVYTVYNQKITPLRARQYATLPATMAVLRELQDSVPDAGPFEVVSAYTGNTWNKVLHGPGKPDVDLPLKQYSIRIFGSDTLHNAGELYNALANGYTYPLDEFRAEAGL